MTVVPRHVLSINGGSSSIRFAVYEASRAPRRTLGGQIERIGSSGTKLIVTDGDGVRRSRRVRADGHRGAVRELLRWLETQPAFASVTAVGHRITHGMAHEAPARVTPRLLAELRRIARFDPDHLPGEIRIIDAFAERHPTLRQWACFDTAFHRHMPRIAKLLPVARTVVGAGVERYGFHGLSYAYLMEELERLDSAAVRGRIVLAHLGSGASLAAIRDGKSIDTSMGFTPASGLMMGTRTGDLDPGLGYYLASTRGITAARFHRIVNRESGLLGVSGISADIRELLAKERTDSHAADAIALFCYQTRKWIGAYAAALGGLDTLVFSAGIGENAPVIRQRICDGLGFLGIALDGARNAKNAPVISRRRAAVTVRVIRTDEELMIARAVLDRDVHESRP